VSDGDASRTIGHERTPEVTVNERTNEFGGVWRSLDDFETPESDSRVHEHS